MIELALLKMTRPEVASDPASLAARLEHLEQRMKRMTAGATAAPQVPVAKPAPAKPEPVFAPAGQPEATKAQVVAPSASVADGATDEAPDVSVQEAKPVEEAVASPSPAATVGEVTFLDLQSVWPALVAGVRDILGSRRYALFRESSPGAVEGSVLVMHLPEHRSFHLQQLNSDNVVAAIVATKASELLGVDVTVEFRTDGEPQLPVVSEVPVIPNKDDLAEAPEEGTDPTSLMSEFLGAEVVEEVEND